MNLNFIAIGIISLIPLVIGYFWYHPNSKIRNWSKINFVDYGDLKIKQVVALFIFSATLIFGYINIVIHQMGFYELFFTDIMMGSDEAQIIVDNFLNEYGNKHRHFGHGVFHGIINAFVFALPFIGIHAILEGRGLKYVLHHFLFWLVTSAIVCGLISEFV